MKNRSAFALSVLAFGYAFLYVPIAILIIYSFNDSRLVTVWSHFSTRWYGELFRNAQIGDALWLSLRVAAASATASVVLGTCAAFAMRRMRSLAARGAFEALVTTPLVPLLATQAAISSGSALSTKSFTAMVPKNITASGGPSFTR